MKSYKNFNGINTITVKGYLFKLNPSQLLNAIIIVLSSIKDFIRYNYSKLNLVWYNAKIVRDELTLLAESRLLHMIIVMLDVSL